MLEKISERGKVSIATIVVILLLGALALVGVALANGSGDDESAAESQEAAGEENGENDEEEVTPVPVEVALATTDTVRSYITATANLVAENEVQVIAESEGRVQSWRYEEGQRVDRGAVMAVLVSDEERIGLAKARARAANASAAYDRASDLFEQQLIPRTEFDTTAMEKRVADQDLAEAEWRLSRKTIKAPISGVVTLRMVQNGQQISPGQQVYTITDFDPLIADLYLPEREAMSLAPGRTVRISPKANESVQFEGRIRRISPVVDTQTGTVKVTIEASDVPAGIRPGTFVQVGVIRQERDGAVVIPKQAVIRELARSYVFVKEDGLAERREVEIGIEDGERVEVLSGVKPGEKVVVAGQGGLKDGTPVLEPGEEPPATEEQQEEAA